MKMLLGSHLFKFLESIFDVVVHRTHQFSGDIVPFKVDTNILGWLHFFEFDWLLGFNGLLQVLYIIVIKKLDIKVINNRCKTYWSGLMSKITWYCSIIIMLLHGALPVGV